MREGHVSNVVERAIVQFRFNRTLELAESFTVDSADLQTASPFQIVGAAWLKARLVNFSFVLGTARRSASVPAPHSRGPPFPGPDIGVRVRVRRTPGMADPGTGMADRNLSVGRSKMTKWNGDRRVRLLHHVTVEMSWTIL